MEIVDFNVGSRPWDNLQPPFLERDGVGPARGWTDQATGVNFGIVNGRMFLGSFPGYPANRWLAFHRTVRQQYAVLSVIFPDPQTFVRFKLACDLLGPITVRYFGTVPEQDLIEERSLPLSSIFTAIEYDRKCWPITQIVISSSDVENSIDDVEFTSEELTGWSRWFCQISRAAHNLRKLLAGIFVGGR